MKKIFLICFMNILLLGCGATVASPVSTGILFTDVRGPVTVSDNTVGHSKRGVASCKSILGLISFGDASIENAMNSSNITKIHHVDHESFSILGLYSRWSTYVYGE